MPKSRSQPSSGRAPAWRGIAPAAALACAALLQGAAAAPNTAEIGFASDLERIDVTVSGASGGAGCVPGQHWDVGAGRCTVAVVLRTASTTRSCSCACPSGQAGSCTARQTGTYSVYGWRTPPNGTEVVSHDGPTSWGSCQQVSSTCKASEPPPPAGPKPGDQFTIDRQFAALICSSSDQGWNAVNVADQYKTQLVNYYKTLGIAGRCPEQEGFRYWLESWRTEAGKIAWEWFNAGQGDWSSLLAKAYTWHWNETLRRQINVAAELHDEQGQGGLEAANVACQQTARKLYGTGVSASYIARSGNRCRIN